MSSDGILSYTMATNGLIDFFRVITVIAGGMLGAWALIRFLQQTHFWSAISLGILGAVTALQEGEQIGQPFIPWRMPMLLAGVLSGMFFLWRTPWLREMELARQARLRKRAEEATRMAMLRR